MKIIIVGGGKVGQAIAKHLSQEEHDIVLIDTDYDRLDRVGSKLDIMAIKGNGLRTTVLMDAGISDTDLIIATTSSDEVNMLCCLTGKRLGAKYAVARIRDPEYTEELTSLKKEMGLDLVINPEQEAASEIARILRFPTAINIDTFVDGRIEMVSFKIKEDGFLTGKTISNIKSRIPLPIIFCAVIHEGEVIIPDGNYIAKPDDTFYVIGSPTEINNFFKTIKRVTEKAKSTLVIGGGRIAFYLCKFLVDVGVDVKIIEINKEHCYQLNEILPECVVINGDGSDSELLDEEDIESFSSVVTLTDRDEENLITALYASNVGVPKVIAKINRANYDKILESFGIDSVVSPKNITAEQIIRFVRALNNTVGHTNIETLHYIVDERAEALGFIADSDTLNLGKALKNIKFQKNILVAAIERKGKVIIPSGNDCILEGDRIIIVSSKKRLTSLNDVFLGGN